jgi:diguanylate cyclase (GGDEF)-like protein
VGDKLLVGIGQRLAESARALDLAGRMADDITSRLGGDEFVLLLDGISHPDDAAQVAQRIETVMAKPFDIDGHEIVATLSIGIACGHSGYESASEILRDADTAVYRAKRNGKHNFAVFDAQMHDEARRRLELETDLRKALGDGSFTLHYQPLVCLTSGHIRGFEALLRLNHPVRGIVSPSEFIPVAEETGLIIPIGFQTLREVCRQIQAWRIRFAKCDVYRDLRVAVNLAAKQLRHPELPDRIDAILAEFGLDHSALELEITENVVMEQGDSAIETLHTLRERGYALAIDDFGTGYSSLSHLHQIPVHIIKIDQSFIRKMSTEDRSFSATVRAMVNLAHNCGLQVIGEGTETLNQLVQLQEMECDWAQGYWFSRPVPAAQAEELLRENLGTKLWRQRVEQIAQGNALGMVTI